MKYLAWATIAIILPAGLFSWFYYSPSHADFSSQSEMIHPDFSVPKSTSSGSPRSSQTPKSAPAPAPVSSESNNAANLFIANCNCSLPGSEPQTVAYEDEKVCGADRNYFSASLKKCLHGCETCENHFQKPGWGVSVLPWSCALF